MVARLLVVVSGLPASGKTTLARGVADRLGMPLLDKDAILEALFDSLGCPGPEDRSRLSRAADEVLLGLAGSARDAVMVSWWHADVAARLGATGAHLVEVHCDCPVEVAAERFVRRRRHPGHLDHLRAPDDHLASLRQAAQVMPGPLGVGELVTVATGQPVDLDAVTRSVRSAATLAGVALGVE